MSHRKVRIRKMGISESKKKIVIDNYFKRECDVNTSIKEAFTKGFELGLKKAPIPSAEPYKGMTNGEVVKAVFPQSMIFEENASKVVWGRSESETKWWNSSYEPKEMEEI